MAFDLNEKRNVLSENSLTSTTKIRVRFNEVDSLKIVWHGHYLKYFEEGREEFGDHFGLNYLKMYEQYGLVLPIVSATCKYKSPLRYGDYAIVETQFINCEAARVNFRYRILRESDDKLVAIGETEQVFLNESGVLQLVVPDFFREWKRQMKLIS